MVSIVRTRVHEPCEFALGNRTVDCSILRHGDCRNCGGLPSNYYPNHRLAEQCISDHVKGPHAYITSHAWL